MVENNIHKFPDPLELRAQKIEAAMMRIKKARGDYFDGTLEIISSMQDGAPPPLSFSANEVKMAKQIMTDMAWAHAVVSKLKQSKVLDRPTMREIFRVWRTAK